MSFLFSVTCWDFSSFSSYRTIYFIQCIVCDADVRFSYQCFAGLKVWFPIFCNFCQPDVANSMPVMHLKILISVVLSRRSVNKHFSSLGVAAAAGKQCHFSVSVSIV